MYHGVFAEDLWTALSTAKCLVLAEDPCVECSTIGCLPWGRGSLRRTKRQRVFGLADDPWNERDVWCMRRIPGPN